jgi:PAS domain S-box-containing protein
LRIAQLSSTTPGSCCEGHDTLYRVIVATAVDAIVVIDRKGTMRSVNNATERLFGYPADELVRRNVKILMLETTGMGLGLSICREIVEAHYSKLTTASAPSGGAVVRVTLSITGRKETADVA